MKVKVTDADYETAMAREFMQPKEKWARLKACAVRIAAERALDANQKRQRQLIAESKTLEGGNMKDVLRWHAVQAELTVVFDEHSKLLDIAFPKAAE